MIKLPVLTYNNNNTLYLAIKLVKYKKIYIVLQSIITLNYLPLQLHFSLLKEFSLDWVECAMGP